MRKKLVRLIFVLLTFSISRGWAESPKVIHLTPDELIRRDALRKELQAATDKFQLLVRAINAEDNSLRLEACLRAEVKATECGPYNGQGQVIKLEKPIEKSDAPR